MADIKTTPLAPSIQVGSTGGADVLVLGAGSAGCVVAARLADAGARVRLVEAGDYPTDPDICDPLKWPFLEGRSFDWGYRTIPQQGTAWRVHTWPRGRVVGGSSCLNAMAHVRGHPTDFEAWAAAGGARWSHAGLLRGFQRSAQPLLHPDAEVSPLVRAYMAAGRAIGAPMLESHNGDQLAGTTPNTLTIRNGRRVSVADAYLAQSRSGLCIETATVAERLLIEGSRVQGVLVRCGGTPRVLHADTVVVCLGTVATPLLLMRSGLGDPAELARFGIAPVQSLPEIGGNLHDHLLAAGNLYSARQPVPQSRLQHSESLMYLHSDDPTRADGAPDCVLACVLLPVVSDAFDRPELGSAYSILFGVTHPTSRGRIRLGGPHAADAPVIDPAYLQTEHDRRVFRAALRLARAVGHAPPLDDWRAREILPASGDPDDFIARAVITHNHPVGACALGAVVDGDLRVQSIENLYVVDASIIPRITTGPINAAVVAIAETWARDVFIRDRPYEPVEKEGAVIAASTGTASGDENSAATSGRTPNWDGI
jgi:pyridoxine 4-oxidase